MISDDTGSDSDEASEWPPFRKVTSEVANFLNFLKGVSYFPSKFV